MSSSGDSFKQLVYAQAMSTPETDLGALYSAARHRIVDLMMSSPAESAELVCEATPEWTVRNVLAHLRGICEDVLSGNMEGVTTDPWTAAQVRRHRSTSVADLLEGWNTDAPFIEAFLSSPDGVHSYRAVFDIATHEADLRGTLGRSVPLSAEMAAYLVPTLARDFVTHSAAAGLPVVRVDTIDGGSHGSSSAECVLKVSQFEFFRARFGRRSGAQVLSYDWGRVDPTPYLPHLFAFGPRDTNLIESV
jgi:uncharacterized protein (TIGR03083 family)